MLQICVLCSCRSIFVGETNQYTFSFDPDMLYVLPEDELDTIKEGIKKLNNTISWELTSESAVKLDVIEKCYLSLRSPASNRLSYKEYHQTCLLYTSDAADEP